MLGNLEQIDPPPHVFDETCSLAQERTLFDEAGDNAFDQRDLGIFKALKAPAIELETEDLVLTVKSGFDHFKDAGFASAPVTVDADRHRARRLLVEQSNDAMRNRLII
ncbi:hypothetical protein ABIF14_008812 [Bradyrhizobium elkanii]